VAGARFHKSIIRKMVSGDSNFIQLKQSNIIHLQRMGLCVSHPPSELALADEDQLQFDDFLKQIQDTTNSALDF